MQDIKMQTKGKGEKRDGPVSELLDPMGCLVLTPLSKMRATACLERVATAGLVRTHGTLVW